MHLKQFFRWNKIYIEAGLFQFSEFLCKMVIKRLSLPFWIYKNDTSAETKKKNSHYCNQAPYCMQHARKTDLLQKELNWHKHNRKDLNLQPLHCGKQLHKEACSMQINQISHDALKKQLHSQSKPCDKHLRSLGRFKPRACQDKERQHTYFYRVKPVLCHREGCCIGASKETCTMATPLWCRTRLGEGWWYDQHNAMASLVYSWTKALASHPHKQWNHHDLWAASPKAVAGSQGTDWGVAGLQQAPSQEPGKRSQNHSCDRELRPHTHLGYVLYKFQYYLGSNFTHTAALGRLCCINTTWKKGGLCMAPDTIPRHTVQPQLRENTSAIMICFNLSHLNLLLIYIRFTVNFFEFFLNASIC